MQFRPLFYVFFVNNIRSTLHVGYCSTFFCAWLVFTLPRISLVGDLVNFTECRENYFVCSVWSQRIGKKRVPKAQGVVEPNVTSLKEAKENKPATNKVRVAVICYVQVCERPPVGRDAAF